MTNMIMNILITLATVFELALTIVAVKVGFRVIDSMKEKDFELHIRKEGFLERA